MPVYEYECGKCGCRHEAIQRFSDPILTKCPRCGGRLRKLISNTSFVLKGSGWYVTDYARKKDGKKGPEKSEKGEKPGEKEKSEKAAAPEGKEKAPGERGEGKKQPPPAPGKEKQ